MKIEISNNKHGIEKIILSVEEGIVELIIKAENDPTGKLLAESLEFQKTAAMDAGTYELDSFNVKLPIPNHICMKGDIENILDMLKKLQVVDVGYLDKLEGEIISISFQGKPPMSAFFAVKSTPSTDYYSESNEEEDLALLLKIEEEDKEAKILELFSSFRQEDRDNILKFSVLLKSVPSEKISELVDRVNEGKKSFGMKV